MSGLVTRKSICLRTRSARNAWPAPYFQAARRIARIQPKEFTQVHATHPGTRRRNTHLGACPCAVHDGVAAVQRELVLEHLQPLALDLVLRGGKGGASECAFRADTTSMYSSRLELLHCTQDARSSSLPDAREVIFDAFSMLAACPHTDTRERGS